MKFYTPHAVIDDRMYQLRRVVINEAGEPWGIFEDSSTRQETIQEKLSNVELITELDAIAWSSKRSLEYMKAQVRHGSTVTPPPSWDSSTPDKVRRSPAVVDIIFSGEPLCPCCDQFMENRADLIEGGYYCEEDLEDLQGTWVCAECQEVAD